MLLPEADLFFISVTFLVNKFWHLPLETYSQQAEYQLSCYRRYHSRQMYTSPRASIHQVNSTGN